MTSRRSSRTRLGILMKSLHGFIIDWFISILAPKETDDARTMTDLLLVQNGADRFTWGKANLNSDGEARDRYISALRAADAKNYASLFDFVRDTPKKS